MPSFGYREHSEPTAFIKLLKNRKLTILIGIASVAVLLVLFSNKGLLRRVMLESELSEKEARITELQQDLAALEKRKTLLLHDRKTIERVARETYGMVRPGELVYRVRPAEPQSVE